MQAGSLARRYARALMSLAGDPKTPQRANASGVNAVGHEVTDKIGTDLRTLAAAYKTAPELGEVLGNASFKKAQRKAILDALLTKIAAHQLVKTFTYLLLDKERLAVLPDISREIDVMIEERAGKVHAEVTSAVALTPAQLAAITATLEKLSGKKVVVEKKQDPALLGGVVAKVGDVVYDGSLRTQLRALRDQLAK